MDKGTDGTVESCLSLSLSVYVCACLGLRLLMLLSFVVG